jgi:hypothetical protein
MDPDLGGPKTCISGTLLETMTESGRFDICISRVPDPDSIRSVGPYPDSETRSGFRRAKKTHINRKIKKFSVLKCCMFSFES